MSAQSSGWALVPLAELVVPDGPIIYGILQPGPDIKDGVPYVRPTEIIDDKINISGLRRTTAEIASRYKRSSLKPDDILLSIVGTIGKVAVVPLALEGGNITQSSCRIRLDQAIASKELIANFLRSPLARSQFDAFRLGTAVPRLNLEDVRKIQVPLPPLSEQQRINAKLACLFARTKAARDELRRIPLLIHHYRKALLEKAFNGDLTVDWRNENQTRRFPSASDRYPERWQERPLQEIAEIQSGLALGKRRSDREKLIAVPYLRVANVQRGHLNLSEIKTVAATEQEIERLVLKEGDILMNEGGDRDKLGRGWVWENQLSPCIHQNHVFRVRLHDKAFPPKYISYYANEFGQAYFFSEGTQTTNLASISKSRLSALPIPIPPTAEAVEIVRQVESAIRRLDSATRDLEQTSNLLDHLDQGLLTRAFRGALVPQDPNDEPSSVLLERIRANHTRSKVGRSKGVAPRSRKNSTDGNRPLEETQVEEDMNKTRKDVSDNHLCDIVKKWGGEIKADDLWRASEMQIDEFYKLLRADVAAKRLQESKDKALIVDARR